MATLGSVLFGLSWMFMYLWTWRELRHYITAAVAEPSEPKPPVSLQAAGAAESADRKPSLRWQSFLIPVLSGAILAAGAAVFNYATGAAASQARLDDQQRRIEVLTTSQRDLKELLRSDYISREEHARQDADLRELRQHEDARVDRIERQVDFLLMHDAHPTRP